jgi:hypothetical protein
LPLAMVGVKYISGTCADGHGHNQGVGRKKGEGGERWHKNKGE